MAERNEQVMQMVSKELQRNPDVQMSILREKAIEIDPSVAGLSARQFNAIYPLQAKRAASRRQPGRGRTQSRRGKRDSAESAGQEGTTTSTRSRKPRQQDEETGAGFARREAIRRILFDFAGVLAEAETRQELVAALSNVDRYVAQIDQVTQPALRKNA